MSAVLPRLDRTHATQQISKAHSDSKTAEAKAKQAKMKMIHLSKELKVRNRSRIGFEHCHAI
jgi:uncharacterized protein YqfA (UPF0365 family)